jgi:hypothetical protein
MDSNHDSQIQNLKSYRLDDRAKSIAGKTCPSRVTTDRGQGKEYVWKSLPVPGYTCARERADACTIIVFSGTPDKQVFYLLLLGVFELAEKVFPVSGAQIISRIIGFPVRI